MTRRANGSAATGCASAAARIITRASRARASPQGTARRTRGPRRERARDIEAHLATVRQSLADAEARARRRAVRHPGRASRARGPARRSSKPCARARRNPRCAASGSKKKPPRSRAKSASRRKRWRAPAPSWIAASSRSGSSIRGSRDLESEREERREHGQPRARTRAGGAGRRARSADSHRVAPFHRKLVAVSLTRMVEQRAQLAQRCAELEAGARRAAMRRSSSCEARLDDCAGAPPRGRVRARRPRGARWKKPTLTARAR